MKTTTHAVFTALAVAMTTLTMTGCATPTQVIQEGIQSTYTSARPAESLAGCIAANAQKLRQRTRSRPRGPDGSIEVLVYDAKGGPIQAMAEEVIVKEDATAVADIYPRPTGSAGTLYINRRVQRPEQMQAALTTGC